MSYNYLPLDRKWLNFQQVKNLLDYDQQVSITFDAHERILKCREYVDNLPKEKSNDGQIEQSQNKHLKSAAAGIGEEVSADIVKLMLMLKIKSLSYGESGVHIETVKRLTEMYNNNVLPVVYSQASSSAGGDFVALSHLSLPLIGLGEVYYQGQKRRSLAVLQELNWQPVSLQSEEGNALLTGTQFTSAYGLLALKRSEQLIKFADAIAALSFDALHCSTESLLPKIRTTQHHKGQVETAAIILKYLQGGEVTGKKSASLEVPYSFRSTSQVHGASKDAFAYVLNVFLKEINSVSENPVFFPDENLVLSGGNSNSHTLALALDFLSTAISALAAISERRSAQILRAQKALPISGNKSDGSRSGMKALQYAAASLVSENKQLSSPASINIISVDQLEDYLAVPGNAATKCLQIINNTEKVLAIELISAAQVLEVTDSNQTAPFVQKLVKDFRQQARFDDDLLLHDHLLKTVDFIQTYKL